MWTYFKPSCVFIADFKKVNVSWVSRVLNTTLFFNIWHRKMIVARHLQVKVFFLVFVALLSLIQWDVRDRYYTQFYSLEYTCVTCCLYICDALRDLVSFVLFQKNMKKQEVVLLAETCNFTKSNTAPWVFFHIFKIIQMVPNRAERLICYIM